MYPEVNDGQQTVGVPEGKDGITSKIPNHHHGIEGSNLNGNNKKNAEIFSLSGDIQKPPPVPEITFRYRAKEMPPAEDEEKGMSRGVVLNPFHFFRSRESSWSPQGDGSIKKSQEMTQNHIVDGAAVSKSVACASDKPLKMSLSRKIMFWFSFLPIIFFFLFITVIIPCEHPGLPGLCSNSTNASTVASGGPSGITVASVL